MRSQKIKWVFHNHLEKFLCLYYLVHQGKAYLPIYRCALKRRTSRYNNVMQKSKSNPNTKLVLEAKKHIIIQYSNRNGVNCFEWHKYLLFLSPLSLYHQKSRVVFSPKLNGFILIISFFSLIHSICLFISRNLSFCCSKNSYWNLCNLRFLTCALPHWHWENLQRLHYILTN